MESRKLDLVVDLVANLPMPMLMPMPMPTLRNEDDRSSVRIQGFLTASDEQRTTERFPRCYRNLEPRQAEE